MPLSRLENFLKNVQGNVLYVNPEELDATDDVSNRGNSRTRPFRTIQRALIESARFSYQPGQDNDRFDKTTIHVSTGVHFIDNRPGYQIDNSGNITDINGSSQSISEFSIGTNFDIQDPANVLHIFNSAEGGVILPRGTSIIGADLRKTKIRPKYIPDPNNNSIPSTAIFRVTGGCFFFGFTLFDGDPADRVFRDFTSNTYNPNYSHHKLTCFEYADGINQIGSSGNTDLDMYYAKLTRAYGTNSGRALPVYPANKDFQKIPEEMKIVGPVSQIGAIEIEDIFSGSNSTDTVATRIVTVITKESHNLAAGTAILVSDVNASGNNGDEYDGTHVVAQVINDTTFTYSLSVVPATTALPNLTGINPSVVPESDTVASASPYIFNCTLRSVFGMNGLHADGSKATGFKSMLAAQFTGIGLQKDDNAFVKYNTTSGVYEDQTTLGSSTTLHVDSLARFKPGFENFHIKGSNKAGLQLVSVFAIGYAKHFVVESGADFSLTNSNSNFGALALEAKGFRDESFTKDDKGFITSLIPPQKNQAKDKTINYLSIATGLTTITAGDTKLFISKFTSKGNPPPDTSSGFILGNKQGDTISCNIENVVESANILMQTPQIPDLGVSAVKIVRVGQNSGINSITSNTFTLETFHQLLPGESVKIISENGSLPDGLENDRKYFAVTTGIGTHQLKLANSRNAAINGNAISGINNLGGKLSIVSSVDDKKPGDEGHPIQYDDTAGGWYINVGSGSGLSTAISTFAAALSPETPSTTFIRKSDDRVDLEKIYRFRYSIPEGSTLAAEPVNGFVLQDSASVIDDSKFQDDNASLTSDTDLRTQNSIITASWGSNVGIITTKQPHNLNVGQPVEIKRLRSANNTLGLDGQGFNRLFTVTSVENPKTFKVGLTTDPGAITKITNIPYTQVDRTVVGSGRTFSPFFTRKDYGSKFQIFTNERVQRFTKSSQDGVYDLTILGYLNSSNVSPFTDQSIKFGQNVNDFKPRVSPDRRNDDPDAAVSFALRDKIGQVKTNDRSKSITKETVFSFIENTGVGLGVTAASVTGAGAIKDLTIDLSREHAFNGVETISNITGGSNYGTNSGADEFYFSVNLVGGNGQGATADVTVGAAATITSIDIVDAGSGYAVNDTLTIKGVPFIAPGTDCEVTVSAIDNKVGDIMQTVGIGSTAYNGINKISQISEAGRFTFKGKAVGDFSTPGGFAYHVGVSTQITNIVHDTISGIATVTLFQDIGLRRGDLIVINDANSEYNGTHVIEDRIGYGSSLSVNIGASSSPTFSGSGAYAHDSGISMRAFNQNVPLYGGQTTVIDTSMSETTTTIGLQNKNMFRRGDYIMIDEEILRIANKNCTEVIRGLFGTLAVSHLRFNAVRKIRVIPVENRRNSIIRASGHTFEYLGFGPGNYSTSLPQTQDRVLSDDDQLFAQSINVNGGSVVYTGLNDKGEFFVGRKKIDALTGEEESTIVQIDQSAVSNKLPSSVNFDDVVVKNSLSSENDTEIIDLKLKGNRSGDIGQSLLLGITQTTPSSSTDNVLFATSFDRGGYLGWVRTTDSSQPWQKFGPISKDANTEHYVIDKLAIGQSDAGTGKVLGVTGDVDITGGIEVSGVSTTAQLEAGTAKVSDLTSGRVVITGTGGELEDSSSLTFNGATLTANTLNVTNNVTASNVSASGTVQGEHLKSTDDAEITDDLTVGGNITVSGSHTVSGNIQTTGSVSGASANITGTATASTFVGAGTIPVGGIIMWSGASVPSNFALCDGSGSTPDLRDRFVVGSGSAYAIGNTGGSKDAEAIAHSHTVTDPGHRHSQTGGSTNDDGGPNVPGSVGGGTLNNIADATTGITLSSGGVSGTDKNLPPYYALAYIMRIS
tara:strand:+ start:7166 stop:12745 length:5580 start_codon:yes stop_codon:yes gene_type:complete